MALVPKIDPNKIFASNAPTQDKPAAFDNYEKGMDETRKNLGRPTIPQLNYLHQTADMKNLYIHQNGAGLPYDPLIEYAENAVTLKDGELKQLVDGAWVETKTKSLPATSVTTASAQNQQQINDFGGAKWYAKVGGYELGATVKLDNGNTVQSTKADNTANPNVDMTGWINEYNVLDQQTMYPNYGIAPAERLKIYVERLPIQAILKTDGTDETINLKAYIAAAKALGKPLQLPKGTINYSDTLVIDFNLNLYGVGRDATLLQFNNTLLGKSALLFVRGSAKSIVQDLTMRDYNFQKSNAIVMTDSRVGVGTPVWKNTFKNVEVLGFNVGLEWTSENILDGATHAHCDSNYLSQCKFSANKVSILGRNCQAVNNVFVGCEFENSTVTWMDGVTYTDNNWSIIEDEAGIGVTIIGTSLIGTGRWYRWTQPAGSSTLFGGSAQIYFHDVRGELRTPHCGVLIDEGIHGVFASSGVDIAINECMTINYGAVVDLMRFGGAVKATFNNVGTALGTGSLNIRLYPTLGKTANTTIGSRSNVLLTDCADVSYIKETSSPYGTYNADMTCNISFQNSHTNSPNRAYSVDTDGWMSLLGSGDIQQLPYTFGHMARGGKLVYNVDSVGSGFGANATAKIVMPKFGRPIKLFAYKHPLRIANDLIFNLYLVKDKANWATTTFNKTTDAILVSTLPSTLNKAGYFEMDVNVLSGVLGSNLAAGQASWLEGRMLLEHVGSVSFAGFVGVEYI